MSNGARDTFDPRFDPAFQPGFDGAVVAAPSSRKSRDASPAQAALAQRSEVADRPTQTSSPDADEEPAESRRPRANPFLLALLAMSFALIAGGLGAAQSVRAIFDTENISVELDYISLEMVKVAAPLAVALGVAIGAGVLFVYAIDWKKHHSS